MEVVLTLLVLAVVVLVGMALQLLFWWIFLTVMGNEVQRQRGRKAELESQVREELARSAGSAARETPGASTEPRT